MKVISNRVVKIINSIRGEKGFTSTYEVFAVIIESLKKYGFKDIATSYLGYKEKFCK